MSRHGASAASEASPPPAGGLAGRLPERLGPLSSERPGGGRRRLVETTLLLLAGLLLAVATANDLVRQTHVNHRLVVDLRTWRVQTAHNYHELSIEQDIYGHSTREVVCGNTSPGGPKQREQLCLVITGPVVRGRRATNGGWYLPPRVEDQRRYRYGCFGTAVVGGLCPR
jgi:hypothetical protein